MGLCASMMLPWKAKRGQPKPRRATHKALFVIRNDGRSSKPEELVFHHPVHSYGHGRSGSQKPARTDCMDVLGRKLRAAKPHRLPCGSTSTSVAAVAADEMRPPVLRSTMDAGKAAAAAAETNSNCRTPMTPRRTPVWQRRILMGARCQLPRFNGLILYDEHGRPLQSSSQNRAVHHKSRASKYDSTGIHKSARRTTTLKDLM